MEKLKAYKDFISSLKSDGIKSVYVNGIVAEATGHFIYSLYRIMNRPLFVVVENNKKARDLYEDIRGMGGNFVRFFSDQDMSYQYIENLDYTNTAFRMEAIVSILENRKDIIITSPEALAKKISTPQKMMEKVLRVDMNSQIDLYRLSEKLVDMGFVRRNMVDSKGEFAIRGDIIDIFQISDTNPVRIELFDTDVDSIRIFDIESQKSIENIDFVDILPMTENIIEREEIPQIIDKINKELINVRKKFGDNAYDKALGKFSRVIDDLENNNHILNSDLLIPYCKHSTASLIDYLSKDFIVVFDDISRIYEDFKEREIFFEDNIKDAILNANLLASHSNIFHRFEALVAATDSYKRVLVSSLVKRLRLVEVDKLFEINTMEQEVFSGKLDAFFERTLESVSLGYKTRIFEDDPKNIELLVDAFRERNLAPSILNDDFEDSDARISIVKKNLTKGFIYIDDKINYISGFDIFDKKKKKKSKSKKVINERDLINYTDLEPGDMIVHENYGVGRYIGIKNIEVNDIKTDYLEIIYQNDDRLFIPTNEMDLVSKFVGSADKAPKLSKLNSTDWQKSKYRAKKAIEEIAENLVKLYATRLNIEGFAFSKDSIWQKEFEDAFIYQETGAQLRAIREIKADMELAKPMDRLLCGDVGFGKTEVALRAAFKAIMDGKQVVMLAPTTILVKQHFRTMMDRFKDFPVNIDFLSRFKTPALKADVKRRLRSGESDFVVGTHALLAKDVKFKNLGLLIVDEEQRFGVKDKEKIKELSQDVDVLTLSATPIPRTLQMSLSGIRDMSLLDEHPDNRQPINTYVMEFNPVIIREAILKEMNRGGQVYFVYNRVNGIHTIASYLNELVPEARIGLSHGRMSTRELENVLEVFTEGEYDILLTTTIIETGMDIQNVNTIVVYNADQMGLSQLYQLKGRIGRSDRSAFAYFTYQRDKVMTDIVEKRLKAIKDFNELGSGYKIAMRDLELRGAGNMLGESQSGHIESIGYDLYVRMLKDAIDSVKGIKPKESFEVKIDFQISAYLPDKYIQEANEKINMYKKISYISNKEEYYDVIDEITDRYGSIPKPVQNIVDIALIKAYMIEAGIGKALQLDEEVVLECADFNNIKIKDLEALAQTYDGYLRFDLRRAPKIYIKNDKSFLSNMISLLETVLKIIGGKNEEK